jgi:hypothetical protein
VGWILALPGGGTANREGPWLAARRPMAVAEELEQRRRWQYWAMSL